MINPSKIPPWNREDTDIPSTLYSIPFPAAPVIPFWHCQVCFGAPLLPPYAVPWLPHRRVFELLQRGICHVMILHPLFSLISRHGNVSRRKQEIQEKTKP